MKNDADEGTGLGLVARGMNDDRSTAGERQSGPADPDQPKAVIWDLDGTLSDDRARAHFVEVEKGRKRDWRSYFDAIDEDPPIAASMEILQAMRAYGARVVFLTGRPEYTRPKTERWLAANGLSEYDLLLMRPDGEFRPAGEFKIDEVRKLQERYNIVCAFEDRIDVADHLRSTGIPVFLYGAGAEAAAEALELADISQDELDARAAVDQEARGGIEDRDQEGLPGV
jgi:phosphoglycolate phosphatase-like HAD superfamily hydrolase